MVFGCNHDAAHDKPIDGKLRIVSLAPSVTEVLFELGSGDSLVGVTDHCDYPPEAASLRRVGGFGAPNLEMLLALNPDLVIAAGFERKELIGALQQSGIRVLDVRIRDFEELFNAIQQIGDAVDRQQQAKNVVARLRAELDAVTTQDGAASRRRRPKVFVEIAEQPLITAGGTSFLDDLIARAGGVNVAHEISREYPIISSEKVIEWNPDAILIAKMARREGAALQVSQRIGWADIAAVREGNIVDDIPADLLFRPGPRLIEGVKALAARLRRAVPRRAISGIEDPG